MQNPDSILTIEELAVYLKLSKSTLYKLCVEGKVPGQKVGRHWRFHRTVIDQWIGLKPDVNPTTPQGAVSQEVTVHGVKKPRFCFKNGGKTSQCSTIFRQTFVFGSKTAITRERLPQEDIKETMETSAGSAGKGKTNTSTGSRRVRTKSRENLRQRPSSQKSGL